MNTNLDQADIINKYNNIQSIWNKNDHWHWITFQKISKFISLHGSMLNEKKSVILNAGSAGNNYGLLVDKMIHIDIADEKIKNIPGSIIASIENIPVPDQSFNAILCVGSVINYCDPISSIHEFSRVIKAGGTLILEFENSKTLELLFSKNYNKKAVLIETFYEGKETIWFYSEKYIEEILQMNNFMIKKKERFHILSPWIYRITKRINFSASFAKLDYFFKYLPFIKKVSSNIILIAEKIK